jgi:hypothetical protein
MAVMVRAAALRLRAGAAGDAGQPQEWATRRLDRLPCWV